MRTGIRAIVLIVAIMTSLILAAGTSYATRKNVVVSELSWSGSVGLCQIMKHVLETKVGIPVKIQQLSTAVTWAGMDRGDVDIFSDVWSINQDAGIKKYVNERKTIELQLSYRGAPQGFLVPTWVSKKYGIVSIEDMNKHTELFDTNGNGKGDMWLGAPAWPCTEINKIKLRDYKLNYEPLLLDQWVFLTVLKEKMRKKEPIIFYYWGPEWIFSKYDLTWVKEPKYEPKKWRFVEKKPEESKITCEYKPCDIYVGISKQLKDRVPKAYKFFKNWKIPMKEVSFLIAEIEDVPDNPKKDPSKVAKKWVEDHPEIVKSWLKGL